jgi:hypothetical protein
MGIKQANRWNVARLKESAPLLVLQARDGGVSLLAGMSLEVNQRRLTVADAVVAGGSAHLQPGEEARVTLVFDGPAVVVTLQLSLSGDAETALLSATIVNRGRKPVSLGRCALVDLATGSGECRFGDDDGRAVFLQSSGSIARNQVRRVADATKPQLSWALLHMVSQAARQALHLGFVTLDRVPAFHELTGNAAGKVVSLGSICDFQGWELAPGQSVQTETLMIEARDDLHASLHRWADRVAAHYHPRIWPKTPAGWVGWSWVDGFNVERYEDVVMRNAKAIRRRLPGHDIEYLWVSIGNIARGYPGNWLEFNRESFPHGHEWLVRQLNRLGFKPGFWCGAFWICSGLEERVAALKEAMLQKNGQPAVARPEWQYGDAGRMPRAQRPRIFALDPTHPKSLEFLREVFATYRKWGVRYYMVDFLNAVTCPMPGSTAYDAPHDKSRVKGPAVLRQGLQAIREAAGPDTYLLSSTGPTFWNVGLMDGCRTGSDYGEGRALNPESYFYPATFVINSPGFWTSHQYASDNMASSYFTHRKLYLNDAGNVMTVDKPVALSEAQITATIFGLCGGPVMLGDDVDRMAEERLALIRKVFPRMPEMAVPVDLFDSPAPDYPKIFWQHVSASWDEWEVVGALNYGDKPLEISVALERLGLDPRAACTVWEFWNEQYLGTVTGKLPVLVPPRSAKLYRIARQRPHPWVLSTDMHTQQGRCELRDVKWDAATLTLSGLAVRPAGESGNVFITAPKGLRVENPRRHWIAKDGRDNTLVIRRAFQFTSQPERWNVCFAPVDRPVDPSKLDLT